MKKLLLSLTAVIAAGLLTSNAAFGQITLTATPGSQNNLSPGGTFNVTISLSVSGTTPANVQSFDLLLETIAANSGFFAISGVTPAASGIPNSVATYPDSLTSAKSNHAGFAQNQFGQGFTFDSVRATSPFSNVTLETISFNIAANVPAGTYTFSTTQNATSAGRGSSVNDSNGSTFFVNTPATFSITVVPEPATISLLALAGIGAVGFYRFRAKGRV